MILHLVSVSNQLTSYFDRSIVVTKIEKKGGRVERSHDHQHCLEMNG